METSRKEVTDYKCNLTWQYVKQNRHRPKPDLYVLSKLFSQTASIFVLSVWRVTRADEQVLTEHHH